MNQLSYTDAQTDRHFSGVRLYYQAQSISSFTHLRYQQMALSPGIVKMFEKITKTRYRGRFLLKIKNEVIAESAQIGAVPKINGSGDLARWRRRSKSPAGSFSKGAGSQRQCCPGL